MNKLLTIIGVGLLTGCMLKPDTAPEVPTENPSEMEVEHIAPIERNEPWVTDEDGRILSDPENMIPSNFRE